MSPSISLPPHDAPLSGGSPFPPIADYGFLSDCHTGALVAADGSVEWMCIPRFDSPSVFGSRSEERRVGKECRSRCAPDDYTTNGMRVNSWRMSSMTL